MSLIRLECKSTKQLERTCAELESLGVTSFCLSAKDQSVGTGRGVSFCTYNKEYTRGVQGICAGDDEKYYKRKEFIAAVKRVLGESE